MRNIKLILVIFLFPLPVFAAGMDNWFFHPGVGLGVNSAQETYFRLGVDLGLHLNENFSTGVSAFYSAGARPEHDRAIGAGPFVGYTYPVFEFLSVSAREDVDYVDQRNPVLLRGSTYTHDQEYGIASTTYAGVNISFTRHFGVSVGYALVVGLTNSALGDGRSGITGGLSIGI